MIRRLKRALGIDFSLKAALRNPSIYGRQFSLPRLSFRELVHDRLHTGTRATILQVGANDGEANDPMGDLLLRCAANIDVALLIEPQPGAFERLTRRYREAGHVRCLKTAIDWQGGERLLYSIDRERTAARLRRPISDGIASFSKDHVLAVLQRHCENLGPEEIDELLHVEQVPVSTLHDALRSAGINGAPDVALIDTEGFDGEILRMIAGAELWPEIIQYEHKHLGRDERRNVARLLMANGYRLWTDHADVWGCRIAS